MNNEQQTQGTPSHSTTPSHQSGANNLESEFQQLGKRLGDALQAALNSEQRHQFERELRSGMNTLSTELESAVQKARTTDVGSKVEQTVVKAADTVKTSKVTAEMRDNLAHGLRELNDQLAKLTAQLEHHQASPDTSTPTSGGSHSPSDPNTLPKTDDMAPPPLG